MVINLYVLFVLLNPIVSKFNGISNLSLSDFDYKKIEEFLKNNKVKVIEIQRSKGYSTRKSIDIDKLSKVIKFIKNIDESNKKITFAREV